MTTNQAPNPRDFKSWEDAFQYPVPVVRRLEQQLRSNINENGDKLRSLVGNSYRDLLGTAERIVEMDHQIHSVEFRLGDIGQKCNARAIERIAANQRRTAKAQKDRNYGRNALASNIALLQRCMTQALQVIKRGNLPLRAAKLLVIARLLFTSASKSPDPPGLLDNLKSKLTSLRRKLLSHIDKRLASTNIEKSALIDTLAAFSLATTSTPKDVLNHFLHVRGSTLGDLVESPTQTDLHDALVLLITTIKEVQAVFPKQLSALLSRLQDEPLLQDSAIRDMPELNLDIYERWIADDVLRFTPWLRHDQLQGSAATAILKKWVAQTRSTLLKGLNALLDKTHDVTAIIMLRKEFVSKSLSGDRKLPGLDPISFFEELRACFNRRLQDFIVSSTVGIGHIVEEYLNGGNIQSVVKPGSVTDLWGPENLDTEPGKGSINLRNLIHNASRGKDASLQSLAQSLTLWSSRLATWSSTIKSMCEDRWNDDLDLDIEDDFEIDSPQDLLAREDPDELQKLLVTQKEKSLKMVYEKVQSSAEDKGSAVRLLRLLREIGHQASMGESQAPTSKPPASLFRTLHEILAEQILTKSLEEQKVASKPPKLFVRSPPTTLWEGSSPLPVQPSPACFRYLHDTCRIMKDVGSDLWSPSAVNILKSRLRESVVVSLNKALLDKSSINGSGQEQQHAKQSGESSTSEKGEAAGNGTESPDNPSASNTLENKLIQALFDLLYLDKMFMTSTSHDTAATFDGTIKDVLKRVKLEDNAIERLRRSSGDYYKRSYLLFGLFAAT
ncbi:hypothetical protein AUEXF2481DRAFT_36567 [Aureobasidium subglaciale EXF-2481]|uniref:Conserved oligomeric Golgi complex subunit 1 n=1 Tax=Aureobasidium subglaciale (strain EXF-2481) TaxID=1043005 RepID=A0A074YSY5_AURSE|nr:uncharacterized protein AUEXF2481DRAFT_36567 [Aureobasidium subglaciale EXF-2481]KAI5207596.1 hypothetical protein E4T38_03313 [Aureobasidium subglaciale]KAI5226433.1 hypothetical protein E4T40_03087 [Aureobasidium subglaciale]KAI5229964.1 hypothetical protein E4T41_03310 [Aureobasidium subglaciale]KAI5264426.1 hypothetical protein E4T46_03088 [Aureobasidium subglaciale]KEQ99254.1 hypothetical protein AUEXF2481DRAFT_36567 [Aureobasidium subglaciale EXF-2481]